jgi:hypothetical protein
MNAKTWDRGRPARNERFSASSAEAQLAFSWIMASAAHSLAGGTPAVPVRSLTGYYWNSRADRIERDTRVMK